MEGVQCTNSKNSKMQTESKCVLCCQNTDTEKVTSTENSQSQLLRKISNVYLEHVKPKLESRKGVQFNWTRLKEEDNGSYYQFCSQCFTTGQKLSALNDRLTAVQLEIEDFVNNISKQLLTQWNESPIFWSPDSKNNLSPMEDFCNITCTENDNHLNLELYLNQEMKEEADIKEEVDDADFCDFQSDSTINKSPGFLNAGETQVSPNINDQETHHQDEDSKLRDPSGVSCIRGANENEYSEHHNHQSICSDIKISATNTHDYKDVLQKMQTRKLVVSLTRLPPEKSHLKSKTNDAACYDRKKVVRRNNKLKTTKSKSHKNNVAKTSGQAKSRYSKYDNSDSEYDPITEQRRSYRKRKRSGYHQTKLKLQLAENENTIPPCTECDIVFPSQDEHNTHMIEQHKKDPIECKKCDKIFFSRRTLLAHSNFVHPRRPLTCEHCPELNKFKNDIEYEIHYMSHTGEILYECKQCNMNFSNARAYCRHQRLSTKCGRSYGRFKCTKCSQTFKAKFLLLSHNLTTHEKTKTGNIEHLCKMCGTSFSQLFDLEAHYASVHTKEFIYYCDICGDSFGRISVFRTHRRTHLGNMDCICEFCDKSFSNLYNLKNHILYIHKLDDSELICQKCGKNLPNKRQYHSHIRSCGQSFTCEVCGKTFAHSKNLNQHLRTHTEGLVSCQVCGSQLASNHGLARHMKDLHSEDQQEKFVCEVCGKSFNRKRNCELHVQKIHLGEPFKCTVCDEKFVSLTKMWDHKREIHLGKLRPCRYCDETFVTASHRKLHEEKFHLEKLNKQFKCRVCGMCFQNSNNLQNHRTSQHKDLVIPRVSRKCEICDIDFTSACGLRQHNLRHEKYKNGFIQCEICQQKFLGGRGLKHHLHKVHKISEKKVNKMFSTPS